MKSLRGNIEIKQKRLENIGRAEENNQLVEMELNRIENQVQLIREEIALNRSPEAISAGIDRINSTLGETEAWVNTHSDFLNRIGGNDQLLPGEEPGYIPPLQEPAPAVEEPPLPPVPGEEERR